MVNRRNLLKLSALGTASFAAPLAYSASKITMAYNTGNPPGSSSPKDLIDNAEDFDYLLTGDGVSHPNRLGVPLKSWKGMEGEHNADQIRREAEFDTDQARRESEFDASQDQREDVFGQYLEGSGWTSSGAYAAGISIVSHSQTIDYGGQPYALKASVPASISAPYVTTGNWATESVNFKLVGDNSLRQQLALLPGSRMLGHQRAPITEHIDDVGGMLDAQPVSPWEFAKLVTVKPTLSDPRTWDWAPAIIAAAAVGPVIDRSFSYYRTSNIVIAGRASLTLNLRPFGSAGTLLTISGDASYIDVSVDAEGKGITGVAVPASRVTGRANVDNITGQAVAIGGNQAGVNISGSECRIKVAGSNHLKGTSDNDSIPRLVSVDGAGSGNTVWVNGKNVNAGVVSNQALLTAPVIILDGVTDNGVYHLSGAMEVGHVSIANCLDEVIVSCGTTNITSFTAINCHGSSGVQDGTVTIGKYHIISEDHSRLYVPFRSRTGSTSGSVSIGRLTGGLNLAAVSAGGGIFQIETGTIALSIGEIDLKLHYKAGSTKALVKHTAGSASYGKIRLELFDDTATLTGADKFDFNFPAVVSAPSYLGPSQLVSSSGDVRVGNSIQASVRMAAGVEVTTTSGPYVAQESAAFPRPRIVFGSGIPSGGTWNRGDRILVKNVSLGGVAEYTCVTTGTPGSWRATAWVTNRGTTGARPTLTASEVGVTYLDTTLTSNGKPITWTGTLWVDATGASV